MGRTDPAKQDRAEEAIEEFQEAERIDARPRVQFGDDVVFKLDAKRQRARAQELLELGGQLVEGCGEAVDWKTEAAVPDRVLEEFADTLQRPTSVSAGASEARLRALKSLDILKAGMDAAQTAKAANSIEKMLVHQMVAAHFQAIKLLESAQLERMQPVDRVRLVNAGARLFDVFQTASLTLQKLKTQGQQRVVVQYQQVNVGDGGQAVYLDAQVSAIGSDGKGLGHITSPILPRLADPSSCDRLVDFTHTECSLRSHPRSARFGRIHATEQRQMEQACASKRRLDGPAAFYRCLNDQVLQLRRGPGAPDLGAFTSTEQGQMEQACASRRRLDGPAAFYSCLNDQVLQLRRGPGAPDLSAFTSTEQGQMEQPCPVSRMKVGRDGIPIACFVRSAVRTHPRCPGPRLTVHLHRRETSRQDPLPRRQTGRPAPF